MAARRLSSRLLQHLATRNKSPQIPLFPEPSSQSLLFTNTIFEGYTNPIRTIQTLTEASSEVSKTAENDDTSTSEKAETVPGCQTVAQDAAKHTVMANLKVSARHDLAMIFTCKVCETRSMKTCCRESYEKGVVVVRCGGCNNLHLIADRVGWFGEPGSIEELLAARGEAVKKGSVDSLNLTLEDLAGKNIGECTVSS